MPFPMSQASLAVRFAATERQIPLSRVQWEPTSDGGVVLFFDNTDRWTYSAHAMKEDADLYTPAQMREIVSQFDDMYEV